MHRMDSAMTSGLKIEVDMFSGRPNPEFELQGDQAESLQRLLDTQRQPSKTAQIADQLGFRGFVVTSAAAGGASYRVKDDIVQIGGSAYMDPNKDVQTYILSILPPALKAMILPVLDAR
jgi:hypothetical protein